MSIQDSVAPASETKFNPRDLILAFDQFMKILDAATTPTGDGGRRVGGVSHAVVLSEETSKLQAELLLALRMLIYSHGIPRKFGVQVPIGGTGAAADLTAVLEGALSVIAIPCDRWNLLQDKNPGSNHHRWQLGDIIEADLLGTLESSQKLLHVHTDPQESLLQEEDPTTHLRQPGGNMLNAKEPSSYGLTVTEAAKRLMEEDVIDGLALTNAKARISKACSDGRLEYEGVCDLPPGVVPISMLVQRGVQWAAEAGEA